MVLTLPGGVNSEIGGVTLYYVSETPAYLLGELFVQKTILATQNGFSLSQIDQETLSGGDNSYTASSANEVLIVQPPSGTTPSSVPTISASNYLLVVDAFTTETDLEISSTLPGGVSVWAGDGGGTIHLTNATSATISASDGNWTLVGDNVLPPSEADDPGNIVVSTGSGNNTIKLFYGDISIDSGAADGDGTPGGSVFDFYLGNVMLTLTGGDSSSQTTHDTVNGGAEGSSAFAYLADNSTSYEIDITVASDTVTGTPTYDAVTIYENLANIVFTNGAAVSTIYGGGYSVSGGGGATTIDAGGTGTAGVVYEAEASNFFAASLGITSDSALYDSVTDNSSSEDTLIAGAGYTYIDAAGHTQSALSIEGGTGNATMVGASSGETIFEFGYTTSGGATVSTGNGLSNSILIENWTSSDYLYLGNGVTASTPTITGSTALIQLSDGTKITIEGSTFSTSQIVSTNPLAS